MSSDKSLIEVAKKVDLEGFDYAFRDYSSFEEVKDAEFHKLREAYISAADALEAYLPEPDEWYEDDE